MVDWADEQSKAIVARIVKWLEDDSRPVTELSPIWDQVAASLRAAERRGIERAAQTVKLLSTTVGADPDIDYAFSIISETILGLAAPPADATKGVEP